MLWKIHGHCHQPCKLYYVIASRTNLLIGWTRILNCLVKKWWHAYPSGAPEFTPVFSGVRVTRSLVLYVCFVERCLSFCLLSLFFWPLCCLFFLRCVDSDCPFGIFKLFLLLIDRSSSPACMPCFFKYYKYDITIHNLYLDENLSLPSAVGNPR
jgi:hypothetical protein